MQVWNTPFPSKDTKRGPAVLFLLISKKASGRVSLEIRYSDAVHESNILSQRACSSHYTCHFYPLISSVPSQCLCRYLILQRKTTSSVLTNYETELYRRTSQIQQGNSAMRWQNASNAQKGKRNINRSTCQTTCKERKHKERKKERRKEREKKRRASGEGRGTQHKQCIFTPFPSSEKSRLSLDQRCRTITK